MAQSLASMNVMKVAGMWCGAAVLAAVLISHRDQIGALISEHASQSERQAQARPTEPKGELRRSSGVVELRANPRNGHFETKVQINGRTVDVMVDTGATVVALSWEDARAAGIHVTPADFTGIVNTANGKARVAPVTLDTVSIDDIQVRNVRGVVSERGAMTVSLLGMSFLSRVKSEMGDGILTLKEAR